MGDAMTADDAYPKGAGTLVRYDQARQALAECVRVDDVKSIRDKALAMQTYAKQAQDYALIDQATDIRLRAEIRAGELLAEMKANGTRQKPGDVGTPKSRKKDTDFVSASLAPSLSDLGISHKQSSRWQKFAALSRAEQEAVIERTQERTRAAVAGASSRKKKSDDDDEDTGPEFEMTKQAIDLALKIRHLVIDEARKMRPEDRKSVLLALRYEARDMPGLFVREFGRAKK